MPPLPRITATELVRALRRAGWEPDHQTGSHLILRHPQRPGRVTVPLHTGRTLRLGTLKTILDQAGPTADGLRDLL
ncbi:MAG: type II toxin-antitoxin system HicA family toxin [Chloroflexi bacterium]|nr:type II toxin-antitoxin system HicA family toxin [Chloroflexota bacterium]